ncbi:MAG: alpha-ketoglutarate decarboxylase [Gelidibacter sp.]
MPFLLKKSVFTCLIIIGFSLNSQAQIHTPQSASDFWNHVRFGGGIGLSFGDGFFSGTLAPSAIYEFNDQFALGVGLNGTYNKLKNTYKSTVLGGSLIGLFNPIQELQLSAELEQLNVSRNWDDNVARANENYWYPALFVGAGYRSRNVAVGIKYDVLYDKNKSIYADAWAPFVRVYF